MYYYRIYGMKIATDMEFRQLVVCEDEQPIDIEVLEGTISEDIYAQEGKCQYFFGEQRGWLINKTCYLETTDGTRLIYKCKPGGNRMYLQTYILGYGMSMLAMQRGMLSIHCSALANEEGALLIAGESGAGKSTVTSAFLEQGYRLLADDMAWVEITEEQTVMVRPAFPYQKLCRNVAIEQGYDLDELIYINEEKDKFLAPYRGEFRTEAVRIKGFIMLGVTNEDAIVSSEEKGIEKFQMCANNLFLRHLLGPNKYQPHIGQKCMKMAAGIPMYYIGRPNGKETTKQVIEKAFEIVESL